MNKILTTLLFALVTSIGFAQQKGTLHGRVFQLENKQPLHGATIKISRPADTAVLSKVASDAEGMFSIVNLPLMDSLLVEITFTGLEEFYGVVILKDKLFNMESIGLRPASKLLKEVHVKAFRKPYVIREDTVEFDATLVKTPPNSKAEDLLRRLPGLNMDRNGKLTYNGKPVTKIFVDGKVFFSEDGGVALSHIPSELVDKVQLTDARTEVEKKMSLDKKPLEYGLNLKLKAGDKRFGDLYAALGTDKRYDLSGMASSIGKRRIGITSGFNNINKESSGSAISTAGGGVIKTLYTGVEYTERVGKNKSVSGNYTFNRPFTEKESVTQRRQNILLDSSLFSHSTSNSTDKGRSHLVSVNTDIIPGMFLMATTSLERVDQQSEMQYHTVGQRGNPINSLNQNYASAGDQYSSLMRLIFNRGYKSSTFGVQAQFQHHANSLDDQNRSVSTYYDQVVPRQDILDQRIQQTDRGNSLMFNATYQYKINPQLSFLLNGRSDINSNAVVRDALRLDASTGTRFRDINSSNDLKTFVSNVSLSPKIDYRTEKYSAGLALPFFCIDQRQTDKLKSLETEKVFLNMAPGLNAGFNINKNNQIGFSSKLDVQNPSLDQLRTITDNTNPLLQSVGNPYLKPSKSFSNKLSYSVSFNEGRGSRIDFLTSYTREMNRITPSVVYDASGRQLMSYVNVNGNSVQDALLNYSGVLKVGQQTISTMVSVRGIIRRDQLSLNNTFSPVRTSTLEGGFFLTYNNGEKVLMELGYRPSFNDLKYSANPAGDQRYAIQNLDGALDFYLFSKLKWKNVITFQYNNQLPKEFDKSSLLWNVDFSLLCLKNKGEIKLTGYDLLRQNNNMIRTVSGNFIEDSRSNNLRRFLMFGFAYNFKSLKSS